MLDKLKENKALFSGGWADILRDEEKNAIETILEALDNSTSNYALYDLAREMRRDGSMYYASRIEEIISKGEVKQ